MSTMRFRVRKTAVKPQEHDGSRNINWFAGLLSSLLAIAGIVVFAVQVRNGLLLFEDSDEMEVLTAGRMLVHGHHLYKDVLVTHGPIPYMISQIYALAVSETNFSFVRASQSILALLSCAALVFSPALKTAACRIFAGASYILILGVLWNLEGLNILEYDTIAGYFFLIVSAQLVAPLMLGVYPSTYGLWAAGAATTLTCFCAYSNGISALLLSGSSIPYLRPFSWPERVPYIKTFLFGALAASLPIFVWLYFFGDIKGYFVYHFYFNQLVEPKYIGVSPWDVLRTFRVSLNAQGLLHTLALFLMCYWLCTILVMQHKRSTADSDEHKGKLRSEIVAWVCLAAAIVATNVLGRPAYADSSFLVVNAGMAVLASALILEHLLISSSARTL